MTDIATALKAEIARIAAKQIRAETQRLKKLTNQYRSDIAALKRRASALEQQVKRLAKATPKKPVAIPTEDAPELQRFSASGFAAHRQRLGLSARELALLLGVSDQSVSKWETGKSYPRNAHFAAIAAVRKMNKTQAAEQLQRLAT